ncbi:hypothetical protein OG730_00935 [Streptomyces sp. NBC_01298]|uniref:hypothetical protein n=1 Tax=Streptomyces sp. NBC_01298 TaxID=2903817 RepID=UPI002E0EE9E4|nr:hypothetical protein OG730_00935 [Streptomyces sp. NBC_01298]
MTHPASRRAAAAALAVAALVVTGCGRDSPGGDAKPAPVTATLPARTPDPEAPGTPDSIARAYMTLSHTVTAADATTPHRRAEAYMTSDNPERGTGQRVHDAPPPGVTRQPADMKVSLARPQEDRLIYRVTYTPVLTRGGKIIKTEPVVTTYVVCDWQPNNTYRVSREDPDINPEIDN